MTRPERSFLRFAIYVAFFPQLVAGPVLRAGQFMPQLAGRLALDAQKLRSGIHLFGVGPVKNVVVADNVAPLVDHIFGSPQGLSSLAIWTGAAGFMIQIYCDFSGYTDMARGASRMLGLEIPIKFDHPYLARSITDFWRRWHISLSSWLRDYLYIPLGGNRSGTAATYRNLILTMGLGGLWHGASWNFVIWGLYQGVLLALERAFGIGDSHASSFAARAFRWAACQYLVLLGWVFFRVKDAADLRYCLGRFLVPDFDVGLQDIGLGNFNPFLVFGIIGAFVVAHVVSYQIGGIATWLDTRPGRVRWLVYVASAILLIALWPAQQSTFIYFQF
jgi:alginate O-acetyltransferase complex protein AlgI